MSAFNIYNGNGTQTQFPITFDYFDEDDIEGQKLKKKKRPTKLCKYLASQLHPVQKLDSNGKKIENS